MNMHCYLFVAALLVLSAHGSAKTIHVPADQPSIQAGIDAAVNGDTVLVAPGTYVENVNFLGKEINVRSSDRAATTVIDGSNPLNPDHGSVVTFNHQEQNAVLDGFTLVHGTGYRIGSQKCGGGIFLDSASPTIRNNIIMQNTAALGGAVYGKFSWSNIHSNTIFDNEGVRGAGVYADYCWFQLKCCRISRNTATACGGGLYCHESMLLLSNCLISENISVDEHGGGVFFLNSSPSIRNSTFAANSVENGNGVGGGICCYGSYPIIWNSILWNNNAGTGPEMWLGTLQEPSTLYINYSDVEGGSDSITVLTGSSMQWGSGMIEDAPLFVDEANHDYHLTYLSPCRDTGDNSMVEDFLDFEGDPRIAWGNTVDMGADEFHTHYYCTGDFTLGGEVQGKFVGIPGTTPIGICFGSGLVELPQTTPWGEFYLDSPWTVLWLDMVIDPDGVLIVREKIPLNSSAPCTVFMQAIIGLNPDSLTNPFIMDVR